MPITAVPLDSVLGVSTLGKSLVTAASAAAARSTLSVPSSSEVASALENYTPTADLGGAAFLDVGTGSGTVAAGNDSRLSDARTPTAHTHAISDVTGLQTAIDGKAATSHTHAISDVTGLQTAIDGKAATSHTHTASQVTDLGNAATRNVGTTAGTVAAGDDARFGAGGMIPVLRPSSIVWVTAGVAGNVHVGAGSNAKYTSGVGVPASISADHTCQLTFDIPTALPSGKTAKLRVWLIAAATTGDSKLSYRAAVVGPGDDPSSVSLTSSGTQTLTRGGSDSNVLKEIKIAVPVTLTEGKELRGNVVFETSGWTLAVVETASFALIWE